MVAQGGSSVGTYNLENLKLEYETIENIEMATEVTSSYNTSRSQAFAHCTLMKTTFLGQGICTNRRECKPTPQTDESYRLPLLENHLTNRFREVPLS